jgi:hypothetical protein
VHRIPEILPRAITDAILAQLTAFSQVLSCSHPEIS